MNNMDQTGKIIPLDWRHRYTPAIGMLRRIKYLADTVLVRTADEAAVRLRMIALVLESETGKSILRGEQ
jgi:hypothetical protein